MIPELLNLDRRLPPLSQTEVYQSLANALDDRSGFGILFIACSPAEADRLIPRLQGDLSEKNMTVLNLDKPIDNLYRLVERRPDLDLLDVLFIRGLEKSLEADIKPGYGGLGDYYSLNTVPPILNHLNQQREGFRDGFPHLCFAFILPPFGIRYFVRRAPDFYDWNSGIFEIHSDNEKSQSHSYLVRASEIPTDDNKISPYIQGLLASLQGNWEEAIDCYDKAIAIQPDSYPAWYYRGFALEKLGRYEEEIASYDKAIATQPDSYPAWYNRGVALEKLGRYEEAIASYDKAIAIQPDYHKAWNNRGFVLEKLGRYEEAIERQPKV